MQARDDPLNKPTLLWLNGGPGGSSIVGLFEEIGGCEFASANKTRINPYSWTNFANLLFLEYVARSP
jgi:cathepsin A (carboxypeptidase C)